MAFIPLLAGGLAAVGSFMQATQTAGEMRQAASIQEYQAGISRNAAAQAGQQASAEEERVRREARQVLGEQRAGMAESGTALTGSNLDIMRQSAALAELDALNVQYQGETRRRSLLNEAEAQEYNARGLRSSARSVMRTRWLSALGSGVGAYGSAGGNLYLGKNPGKG